MKRHVSMMELVEDYVSFRRSLGYQIRTEAQMLVGFAKFSDASGHRGPLTTELMLRWAQLPTHAARLYRARRLEVVRCFAKHRKLFDPRTEIPNRLMLGRAHARRPPNIYTAEDIAALLAGARKISPSGPIRRSTIETLLALLACTGLRVSEALKLGREDFDRANGVLIVRETKFHKSRLVPLHPSATKALLAYEKKRDRVYRRPKASTLFVSSYGSRMTYAMALYGFHCALRLSDKNVQHGTYRPRLHDLRHTFACRRLELWYRSNVDPNYAVSSLSTYLGHVKVSDTYWYLTGTKGAMRNATSRFLAPTLTEIGGRS